MTDLIQAGNDSIVAARALSGIETT